MRVENARRKAQLVEKDISDITKRKEELDTKLTELREEINSLREKIKEKREQRNIKPKKQFKQADPTDKFLSLEEIVEMQRKE